MTTSRTLHLYDSHPSIDASMEDFETSSRTLSPELYRTHSRSQITFRSPEASEYSEYADNDPRKSWSPPAWRKASSGWFKHQAGLMSPDRSRESSPQLEHIQDVDEEELFAAAGIPLPGSPSKGRSEERSLSPEQVREPMRKVNGNSIDSRSTDYEKDPQKDGTKNCTSQTRSHYSLSREKRGTRGCETNQSEQPVLPKLIDRGPFPLTSFWVSRFPCDT